MPAARYWRISAIDAYSGGDLELSEVHLYGPSGRADAAASISSSLQPVSGDVSHLQDDDTATSCRFSAQDIRASGFSIEWDFAVETEVTGLRFGAADLSDTFVSSATLERLLPTGVWETVISGGRWPYPGAREITPVPSSAVLGTPTVFSPTDKSPGIMLSGSGTTWSATSGVQGTIRSVAKANSGKWYVEFSTSDEDTIIGIASRGHGLDKSLGSVYGGVGFSSYQVYISGNNQEKPPFSAVGLTGMVLDLDSSPRTVRFIRGASSTQTLQIPWAGDVYVAGGVPDYFWSNEATLNAGQSAFANAVPSGHIAGFGDLVGGLELGQVPLRASGNKKCVVISGGASAPAGPVLQPLASTRDMQDGGGYCIYGTTELDADPTDVPVRRRVQLYNQRDGRLVRETWSDAATGAYRFDHIRGGDGTRYFVVAFDHTGDKRAVIADNLVPEVMP